MTARLWPIICLVFTWTPLFGQEACEHDDDSLENQLEENIIFDTARTAEDFLNESLRHFFSNGFHGWRDFTMLTSSLDWGEWLDFFLSIHSSFEYRYVTCNDIGQCAQGEVVSYFSRMPSTEATEAANSVLDWISGGELSLGRIFAPGLVKHEFTVKTGDGDVEQADVFEYTPRQITNNPDDYPVRNDTDPLVTDKRCRNNFGELRDGQPAYGSGGGDLQSTEIPDTAGYLRVVQVGWYCYADATGVVCRRVWGYEWVDW